jgi:hypothetical protein
VVRASVPWVGRRQRHSEFTGLSRSELERLAKDRRTPTGLRMKAVAELKYWGARNRQKRSK